jgi:RimJ/RimL family protein N-acetyltransferase
MDDHGLMFQAGYIGAFRDGEPCGIIAHCWNGLILLQAPETEVLRALCAALPGLPSIGRRGVKGVSGDHPQVQAILDWLGPDGAAVQMNEREALFTLDLAELKIPSLLQQAHIVCRPIEDGDMPTLLPWRVDYVVEALGAQRETVDRDEEEAFLRNYLAAGHGFVLQDVPTGRLLSTAAFNAALPDAVQIGGVWTPREFRGRGYARSVVAGQLLRARGDGVTDAVLFTNDPAATRAYEAVGFEKTGDFGLVLFKNAWFPRD